MFKLWELKEQTANIKLAVLELENEHTVGSE